MKEVEPYVSVIDTWSQICCWVGLFLHCRKFRSITSLRNSATIECVFGHGLVICSEDIVFISTVTSRSIIYMVYVPSCKVRMVMRYLLVAT